MRRMFPLLLVLMLLTLTVDSLIAQEVPTADCPATRQLTEEANLFASIRRYEGVDPADYSAIRQHAAAGFVPLLKESPGFLFYALANIEPDMLAAVNVFTSEDEMRAANDLAADFISEHLAPLLPTPPEVMSGTVQLLIYANYCPEMAEDSADKADGAGSEIASETDTAADMALAYLGYHVYSEYEEEAELAAVNDLIHDQFAPIVSDSPGFILYLTLADNDNNFIALNIFESLEELIAANTRAAEFVAAELADLATSPLASYGGTIAVLDLSGLFPRRGHGRYG